MSKRKKFSLYGKNVIVTGASGGLGREITLRLIRHYGCRVLGVARSREGLEAVGKELGELGGRLAFLTMDASLPEEWERLAEYVRSGSFKPDALINNAGMLPRFARFGDYTGQECDRCLSLDMYSVIVSCREFISLMEERSPSAIVNIASADALCPLAGTSLYSAAKSAVCAFSEALREEYRGRVYIPAVCPGFIRTGIMKGQSRSVSPVIGFFSMPADKAARILLRRVQRGRSRIVFGADAHFMSVGRRIAPVLSQRLFKAVLRASGLELFRDVF